jgi:uncharacterized protein GlcG (DUF336 family)
MYKREVLGLEDARTAAEAILAEASKEPNRPIAVAVADDRGDLIYLAKMDGGYPLFIHMAINKAYTAARFRMHTRAFAERQKQRGWELDTWTDNKVTAVQGGLCIKNADGISLGGIGVSGLQADEDEEIAYVGFKALNL